MKAKGFGTQESKTSVSSTASRFSYKKDELVAGLQLNMTAAEMRARVGSIGIIQNHHLLNLSPRIGSFISCSPYLVLVGPIISLSQISFLVSLLWIFLVKHSLNEEQEATPADQS